MKNKIVSVKDAAAMLGVSDFTIRRRIKDKLIKADIDSKKHGYRISLDSLLDYAKEHESQIAQIGHIIPYNDMDYASRFLNAVYKNNYIPKYDIIPMHNNNKLIDSCPLKNNEANNGANEILNFNPTIIDKIIDRLKAEMADLDLKIELQQLKIEQIAVDNKDENFSEKEKLIQIKQLKSNINKEIKDLEIQKAIITQNKGDFNESKRKQDSC